MIETDFSKEQCQVLFLSPFIFIFASLSSLSCQPHQDKEECRRRNINMPATKKRKPQTLSWESCITDPETKGM